MFLSLALTPPSRNLMKTPAAASSNSACGGKIKFDHLFTILRHMYIYIFPFSVRAWFLSPLGDWQFWASSVDPAGSSGWCDIWNTWRPLCTAVWVEKWVCSRCLFTFWVVCVCTRAAALTTYLIQALWILLAAICWSSCRLEVCEETRGGEKATLYLR